MTVVTSPVNTEERVELGIKAGDTVRVWQKIQEKGKTRLQAFEGIVISRKHGNESGATFTVRRTTGGVGVEKTFPLYSPMIDKIEIIKRSRVRRAKLYYIREKAAREIKRQMRNAQFMNLATASDTETKAQAERDAQAAQEAEEAKAAEEAAKAEAAKAEAEASEETPAATEVVEATTDTLKEAGDAEAPKKG